MCKTFLGVVSGRKNLGNYVLEGLEVLRLAFPYRACSPSALLQLA